MTQKSENKSPKKVKKVKNEWHHSKKDIEMRKIEHAIFPPHNGRNNSPRITGIRVYLGNNSRPNSPGFFYMSKMSDWFSYQRSTILAFFSFHLRLDIPTRKKRGQKMAPTKISVAKKTFP